jgi:UDP-2-acetamido-3-amino-2,3-dideoxy-glucuronate N-acetyltransferase
MLLGEMPRSVRTSGGCHLREGFPDVATTVMDFDSGAQGHIFTSWLHPEKEQKLVVVGEKAMAVFDDAGGERLQLFEHKIELDGGKPRAAKGPARSIPVEGCEPLAKECLHFLESLSNGHRPDTDGEEGLRVLSVLEACQRSMERGGGTVLVNRHGNSTTSPSVPEVDPSAFVHETAVIDPGARIGAGTKIWHFSHILGGTTIGADCSLGQNVVVGPEVHVGDGCKIQNNVTVCKGVTLEERVFCGPSVVFTNVRIPRAAIPRMDQMETTLVREGATIGGNVTIVCGVEIGRYAFIGAGALVTKDVPDYALFLGHPAGRAGWMCACGEQLGDDLSCGACGERYREVDGPAVTLLPSDG